MANDITGRVWVLDTASTSVNVFDLPVNIVSMAWHPNAVDNDLVVQDGRGKPIWTIRATIAAPNHESVGIEKWDNSEPRMPFFGFRLHTMDGGTLYVTTG